MSPFRTRNRILLAKVETTSGTDAAPTVGSNAILVERPQFAPNFEVLETDEVGAMLDSRDPIVGGGNVSETIPCLLKGSAAGGSPPEYGPLLRGCAMSETITASDVTGTAQGGAAESITLAAGASSTADLYKGMVVAITGGTGNGQSNVISAYNGTTKVATVAANWTTPPDNTSAYTIYANALYKPASTDLETLTIYDYQRSVSASVNALVRKIVGAAGTFTLEVTTRGFGRMSFTYTGILPSNPANVADPGSPTYDSSRPVPFINASALLGGSAVKFNRFALNYGATVQQPDDPAAVYGYDVAGVTERAITGTINPTLTLLSTRDTFADFLAGT